MCNRHIFKSVTVIVQRQKSLVILKPIFQQNAKYLASGAGVGQCPRRQNFGLGIPTCWYLKCGNLRFPTPNLEFALAPTPNPDASQWNIGCVGSQRKMLALAMYISCFFCRFHLRLVPNANPISSGIWALGMKMPLHFHRNVCIEFLANVL